MVHNLFVSETRRGNTLWSLPPHRDLSAVAPLDNISEPVSRAGSKTPAPSPYESDPRAVAGERRRPPPAAGFPASAPAASPSASGPHLPSRFLGSAADARPVRRNPDAPGDCPAVCRVRTHLRQLDKAGPPRPRQLRRPRPRRRRAAQAALGTRAARDAHAHVGVPPEDSLGRPATPPGRARAASDARAGSGPRGRCARSSAGGGPAGSPGRSRRNGRGDFRSSLSSAGLG